MGKPTGFMEYGRELPAKLSVDERVLNYREFERPFSGISVEKQAARCMSCGIPFCHSGCPLANNIPDFNDMVYQQNWKAAFEVLRSTNNFPEFTGRICPAPCEAACVLSINKLPTTIEMIEKFIIERAFAEGWVRPQIPAVRTGKKVAIVGSGPAGMAAAVQLNHAGHWVTLFERADRIGGLLRYGIPDFKLEKSVIDRRLAVMEAAGIVFRTNANVGDNVSVDEVMNEFDAVVLTGGSTVARDLPVAGRQLRGVHYAMEFLTQQNKRVAGDKIPKKDEILATDKHVLVIGGGDTGSDCVGTSLRHKAASVTQIELLPKPPTGKNPATPWPQYPNVLKTSTSHEEGGQRMWSVQTQEFLGDNNGNLRAVRLVDVVWEGRQPKEVPGTEREIPCQLALLAIGFVHPQKVGMLEQLGVALDERGNVQTTRYQTSVPKVFAAGDMRRGQSLVVHAISEGREAARQVDIFLTGTSMLESKDYSLTRIID